MLNWIERKIRAGIRWILTKLGKQSMPSYFEQLKAELPAIAKLSNTGGPNGYFAQEAMRFHSIAGTLLESGLALDETSTVDERYFTHTLTRALLEPFFVILYLFDDPSQTTARHEELTNSFKDQYRKLMNDLHEPEWQVFMQAHGSKLEAVNPTWTRTNQLPNVKDMLRRLQNNYHDTLDFLYPLYRITSFDTHGRSLGTLFESVFGKQCNFPVLKLKFAFEIMANQYLVVLNDLRKAGAA